MIRVLNKRNTDRGIYIGRPTPLGNPFTHLTYGSAPHRVNSRDEAVEMYRKWVVRELETNSEAKTQFDSLVAQVRTGNLDMICWCAPLACHGDVLKEMIQRVLDGTQV